MVLPSVDIMRADADDLHRNIGVLQTTVAEMITVKEHQRKKEREEF